jgi:hypothetical protein
MNDTWYTRLFVWVVVAIAVMGMLLAWLAWE